MCNQMTCWIELLEIELFDKIIVCIYRICLLFIFNVYIKRWFGKQPNQTLSSKTKIQIMCLPKPISVGRIWFNVNYEKELSWFSFRVLLYLVWLAKIDKRTLSALLFSETWDGKNKWIHTLMRKKIKLLIYIYIYIYIERERERERDRLTDRRRWKKVE